MLYVNYTKREKFFDGSWNEYDINFQPMTNMLINKYKLNWNIITDDILCVGYFAGSCLYFRQGKYGKIYYKDADIEEIDINDEASDETPIDYIYKLIVDFYPKTKTGLELNKLIDRYIDRSDFLNLTDKLKSQYHI